jgi:hypothetical protein
MQRLALGLIAGLTLLLVALPARAQSAFGFLETPTDGSTVYGIVEVRGWVLDMNAVDNIKIYVDGAYTATADINLPRADVLNVFPTYANGPTSNPGFMTSFAAMGYGNGAHTLTVVVTESANPDNPLTISSVSVLVDNTINQPPIGAIDIPGPDTIEEANSAFPVTGWALDDTGIDHVDIMVDGLIVAGAVCCNVPPTYPPSSASSAVFGTTRPDVQAAFPDPLLFPQSLFSGWQANIDSTSLINGQHELSVRATDIDGASRVIGTRTFTVDNASLNLHPFGDVDLPLDQITFLPVCTSGGLPSGCTPALCAPVNLNHVSGWVLDTGARLDFGQTGYVELLIDGVIIANTRADCIINAAGAFQNCYGINRPDVEQVYPGFVNSDNAGFDFDFYAFDDGAGHLSIQIPLFGSGAVERDVISSGEHTIEIRAGDDAETQILFSSQSANFVTCRPSGGDLPSFGYIDSPQEYQFIDGVALISGWAYDFNGVNHVDIDIDGQVVGTATYGLPRPDVRVHDPRVQSTNVGFSFLLDTTALADSPHDLNVYVVDNQSNRVLIGRRQFVVNNNVPTHGQ